MGETCLNAGQCRLCSCCRRCSGRSGGCRGRGLLPIPASLGGRATGNEQEGRERAVAVVSATKCLLQIVQALLHREGWTRGGGMR